MKRITENPNRIKIIFISSAVLLLFLSIFSVERVVQQKNSSQWVERAYLVKLKLKEAYSSLRDAEAVQSAYLITQDSTLLQRFLSSIGSIPPTLSQLDSLIAEPQRAELQQFAQILQRRIRRLNTVIDSANYIDGMQLYAFFMESRDISDITRSQIARMEKREDVLLNQRLREKQSQERIASVLILLFSVTSLSVLVYSFFKLRKESSLRTQSETNAALLEEKVEERTAEIKQINRELNTKNNELERKNEELSNFTYIASHDLKEPLRKVSVFADRLTQLEEEKLSGEGKKYLDRIQSAIKRMQSLIDSVFSYSRAESGGLELTDLNSVAQHAVEIFEEPIEEKKAIVKIGELPKIYATPGQMEQLFVNLISNSLKYSKPDEQPVIEVTSSKQAEQINRASRKTEGWNIEFRDNGIGFDEQYKDKIFQIFQRLHPSHEYSGTGIGLAICKKIVENHGGIITANSTVNEGSVISVFLPDLPHHSAMAFTKASQEPETSEIKS